MAVIKWDNVGDRTYESGLDRGVLYLPDGSAVPWNGLTSVVEKFDKESSPVYYDGMKINDLISLGDFSASMKAVTYPDEFMEIEGFGAIKDGLFFADQPPKTFGLCYRTLVGTDLEGDEAGYKIHILYNVTAIPTDKTYATSSDDPSLVEFEWELNAVPEDIPGFRPTAHLIVDSRIVDPYLLEELEHTLYGFGLTDAVLLSMPDLINLIQTFFRVEITDHGDGTWTAYSDIEGLITVDAEGYFEIIGVSTWYLNDYTFVVESTANLAQVPRIKIHDVGNGTWTAHTEYDNLIIVSESGVGTIHDANIEIINETTYEISDTPDD